MPVVAIPPGPVITMNQGEVYALPGSACVITTGAIVQRSNLYAGPFIDWSDSISGAYNHVGGFIKCVTGATTVKAVKTLLNGSLPPGVQDSDAGYSAVIMKDNPSYYWNLNETSGTIAVDSKGGANGTISGGVTLNQSGAVGKGMLFDGVDDRIFTSVNVNIPAIVTIEAWVTITPTAFHTILGLDGFKFIFAVAGGNFVSYVADGSPIQSPGFIATPGLHHVVLVHDSLTAKFYLNGQFIISNSQTRPILNLLAGIGGAPAGGNYWNGLIDEVAIYPYALSPQQIQSHYLAKSVPPNSYASSVMASQPSNYWQLDEEGGLVANDLVGGKHGTISGGVLLSQVGVSGKSMKFDGVDDKIVAGNSSTLTPFTVEAWIYPVSSVNYRMVCSTRAAGVVGQFAIYLETGSMMLSALMLYSGGTHFAAFLPNLTINQWQHIVLIFNSTTLQGFVNGQPVSHSLPQPFAAFPGSASYPLGIGYDSNSNFYWNGNIDEVAIYNRALSASEIQSHYLAKFGITNPTSYAAKVVMSGPSNYWRLNETSGTTAVDIVGGANGAIGAGITLNGESGMTFAGGQTITLPSVALPVSMTIEAWINLVDIAANYPMYGSWGIGGATGDTIEFGPTVGGKLWARTTPTADVFSTVASITAGSWHHIAAVMNGSTISFYTNGKFTDSQGFTRTVPGAGPSAIGAGIGVGSYKGLLDDVAIYPRALTPAEILSHYQSR